MKAFIYFTTLVLLSCHSSKPIANKIKNVKAVPIEIKFVLDRNNFTYQFKFLNKSTDSIEILRPMIYGSYCYFRRFVNGDTIAKLRCGSISQNEIAWILLPPKKEISINGELSLKDLFCIIDSEDMIGYVYSGAFKNKNGFSGIFNFEVPPTTFSKLDSVIISKVLF